MGDLISIAKFTGGHGFTNSPASNVITGNPMFLGGIATSETIQPTFSVENLDVTDPDSLIAFFNVQVTESKNHLTGLMQEQDARTKKSQRVQGALARLSEWEESGSPTEPAKQKEFISACDDLLAELPPGSKEAQTISALVDPVRNGLPQTQTFIENNDGLLAVSQANTLRAMHAEKGATVTEGTDSTGRKTYTVNWVEGVPPLGKQQIQTITTTAKSYADGLATQSQMAMIRIQQDVERMSQLNNFCSNILKKHNDSQENVISNIR